MKRRTVILLLCAAAIGAWLLTRSARELPRPARQNEMTNTTAAKERIDVATEQNALTRVIETLDAPRLAVARQSAAKKANGPVSFYAKVTDQSGGQVAGAKLKGTVSAFNEGLRMSEEEAVRKSLFEVLSDPAGIFEIKRERGVWLNILALEKHGYFWENPGFGSFGVGGNAPTRIPSYSTPAQPLLLHLWRKGATEPTIRQGARVRLRAEQEVYALNLLTGQAVMTNEQPDLIIRFTLVSNSAAAARAHRIIRLEFPHGGVLETSDAYPYYAPASGYDPAWSWVYQAADTPPSEANRTRNFYARFRNGRMMAGFRIKFDSMPALEMVVTINPAASPFLEADPAKQITDPDEIRRLDEATRP